MTDYPEALVERVIKAAVETDPVLELIWPDDFAEAEQYVWRQKIHAALDASGLLELYKALCNLIEEIETDGGVDTSCWPLLDEGKAALAKARGEEPKP